MSDSVHRRLVVIVFCVVAVASIAASEAPWFDVARDASATVSPGSDRTRNRTSDAGLFAVAIRSRRYPLPVNEIHAWTVLVRDRDARPVLGAQLDIDGGMPGHGHGFPTQPRVTRELGNGWYLIEGVKFSMPGAWRFAVAVRSGAREDVAMFDVEVTAWDVSEVERLRSLWIRTLGPPPAVPSNRWADAPGARELGHHVFYDAAFSRDGSVSCATCHKPELAFTDGLDRSRGLATTPRNAPTVVGAAWGAWQFWDGRRDSLWSQALTPLETAAEMGVTRLAVLQRIATEPLYRTLYERTFGPLPDLANARRFPIDAGPRGTAVQRERWEAMTAMDRDAVNRAFANVGKALAAYQRLLRPGVSRFDRYVAELLGKGRGGDAALAADEEAGLLLLLTGRAHCLRCHNGPRWTNDSFHNVGSSRVAGERDLGRLPAIDEVIDDPFNCLGSYSDAASESCPELTFIQRDDPILPGAFKVPSLRNLSLTGPYMHAGQFGTLREVLEHYNDPGPAGSGHREIEPLELDSRELDQIEAFLRTLDAPTAADPRWLRPPLQRRRP